MFTLIIIMFLLGVVYAIYDIPQRIVEVLAPQYVKLKGKIIKKNDV